MANASTDVATSEGGGEEEEEEEQVLFCTVSYIHNGYILEYLGQHGNTATANMLLDLPRCRLDGSKQLATSLTTKQGSR